MRKRGGFTLIELLIVVGIIVALAGLLLPVIHRAYMVAERSAIASDLQVISNAVEAYHGDFGIYPGDSPRDTMHGLCAALIAPGPVAEDGADGPGFRLRGATGRVYGPYLPPDRFVMGTMEGQPGDIAMVLPFKQNGKTPSNLDSVLADRLGHVILYFVSNRQAHPGIKPSSYVYSADFVNVGSASMWGAGGGDRTGQLMPAYCFRNLLGAERDGSVAPGAMPITVPYLLISAGTATPVSQSEVYGSDDIHKASQGSGLPDPFGQSDNVANVPLSPLLPIADYNKS